MLIGFRRYYIIYTIPTFSFIFLLCRHTKRDNCAIRHTYICCMIKYPSHILWIGVSPVILYFGPSWAIFFDPDLCGLPSFSISINFCLILADFLLRGNFWGSKSNRILKIWPGLGLGQGLTQPYLGKSEKPCKGSLLVFDLNLVFDDDNKCKHA